MAQLRQLALKLMLAEMEDESVSRTVLEIARRRTPEIRTVEIGTKPLCALGRLVESPGLHP